MSENVDKPKLPESLMATFNIISGIRKDYELGDFSDEIASGSFGSAYKATCLNLKLDLKKEMVVKHSPLSSDGLTNPNFNPIKILVDGLASIEIIKKNPHPNIVNYIFAGIDLETKDLWEVMEYCNNRTLAKLSVSKNFTQDQAMDACYQVASALHHLHSLDITHRDVKPDNILVHKENEKNTFKLADFGLSCIKKDLTTRMGNARFLAPEFITNVNKLSNKIDIWMLGVTLFYCLFKYFPFDGKSEGVVEDKIIKGFVYPQKEAQQLNLHPEVQYLLEGMFEKNPEKRFSAKMVMMKIDEIKNLKSISSSALINYTWLDIPTNLPNVKMNNPICFSGRGIAKLSNQTYFAIDECGMLQQINSSNNNWSYKKQFDVGNPDNLNSIIINKPEDYLVISGCGNQNIYAVKLINLTLKKVWEKTHNSSLNISIFLDNYTFCAGYSDGLLKKYSVNPENELESFKLNCSTICSFCADKNLLELLVGDADGKLHSLDWQSFNSVKWSINVHQNWINSICKNGSFFVTGSDDKTIALLDSSIPPQVISRYKADSLVYQLEFIPNNAKLLALCWGQIVLIEISAGKLCEKSRQPDPKKKGLQSFTMLYNSNVVFGDGEGNLFLMKLK